MHLRLLAVLSLVLPAVAFAEDGKRSSPYSSPQPLGQPHECFTRYPAEAFRKHYEGTAGLSFHVDETGSVKDVTIRKSSGYAVLDQAAIDCVALWRYQPAMQSGHPVEATKRANVVWSLPQSPIPLGDHDCRAEAQQMPSDRQMAIQFVIGTEGDVKNVQLTPSSGSATLDEHLVACVGKWKYQPGMSQGQPAEFAKRMPLSGVAQSTRD